MLTKEKFIDRMVMDCLEELYQAAQPPVSFESLKDEPEFYLHHYLNDNEYKFIIDKYIDLYRLDDGFKDSCDLLIKDMTEGYIDVIYNDEGKNYKKFPSLESEIGKENLDKIVKFIESRKQFYKHNPLLENFRFTMMNYAPSGNKKEVLKYWESKGKPIKIIETDPEFYYDKYYLGLTNDVDDE